MNADAPGLMWVTDGTRVQTAKEGMCWILTAVDHYNCEVVGRHVCKRGDRFAALQPVAYSAPSRTLIPEQASVLVTPTAERL